MLGPTQNFSPINISFAGFPANKKFHKKCKNFAFFTKMNEGGKRKSTANCCKNFTFHKKKICNIFARFCNIFALLIWWKFLIFSWNRLKQNFEKIENFREICNISAKWFSFWLEIGSAILTFIGYKQTDKQIKYDSPYKIFFTSYGLLAS